MKITFTSQNSTPTNKIEANQRYNRSLGLIKVGTKGPVAERLAVVGGSPDVVNHIDELRNWDGEVWAINGTYKWCQENGIDATFYAIDPSPKVINYVDGVRKAVIADTLDKSVMDRLVSSDVEIAYLGDGGLPFGTTAACTAIPIAIERGHKSITFFGCASGFVAGATHAYRDEGKTHGMMIVKCGGVEYMTRPDLAVQAEFMAEISRAVPEFVSVRGNGFLPALIEHGEYDVIGVDDDMWQELKAANEHLKDINPTSLHGSL